MKNIRRALPFVLIVIGLWLLSGCVYVPMFNRTVNGKDAGKYVGDAKSKQPLRTTISSRAAIEKVLGKPFFVTDDMRYSVYSWKKQKGVAIWPLCFQIQGEDTAYAMAIEFDADGIMVGFKIDNVKPQYYLGSFTGAKRFVPYHVLIHQKMLDLGDNPSLLSSTFALMQPDSPRASGFL